MKKADKKQRRREIALGNLKKQLSRKTINQDGTNFSRKEEKAFDEALVSSRIDYLEKIIMKNK